MRILLGLLLVAGALDAAELAGAVRDALTSEAVRRAAVRIERLDAVAPVRVALTDRDGQFRFRGLPQGRYVFRLSKDGYYESLVDTQQRVRPDLPFALRTNQVIEDVAVRLNSNATVSGTITYDDGEPVRSATVVLTSARGYADVAPGMAIAQTDDRGRYRIIDLKPGAYLAKALPPALIDGSDVEVEPAVDARGNPLPIRTYGPTFYPETTSGDSAIPIDLTAGEQREPVNIRLAPMELSRVEGRAVIAETGETDAQAVINLVPEGIHRLLAPHHGQPVQRNEDGSFEIFGVAPGNYRLLATSSRAGRQLWAELPVIVTGADISGLDVGLVPFVQVQAKIQFEGRKPKDEDLEVEVHLTRADEPLVESSVSGDPRRMFSFSRIMAGRYRVALDWGANPNNYYLKEANGRTPDRLEIPQKKDPLRVVLTVSDQAATLRVFPKINATTAVEKVKAGIFFAGAGRATIIDRVTRINSENGFVFRGVPPGRHRVMAWVDQPPCPIYLPGGCDGHGTTVTVDAKSSKQITIPMSDSN